MNLLAALKNNNSYNAFNELYKTWHKRTYFYFLKQAKLENLAKELTQDTFIKIWRYRHNLSLEHPFENQLFQTAKIVWIDELRNRARYRKVITEESSSLIQTANSNEQYDKNFENKDFISHALKHLPPIRRKIFILYRLQGYSYKEIASELGISIKTVENHLSKANKQLKELHLLISILILYTFN